MGTVSRIHETSRAKALEELGVGELSDGSTHEKVVSWSEGDEEALGLPHLAIQTSGDGERTTSIYFLGDKVIVMDGNGSDEPDFWIGDR